MATTPQKSMIDAPQQGGADMEVLETIKKSKGEGGSTKKMNSLEVIQEALSKDMPPGMNMDMFMRKLATLLKDPNNRLVQVGNTVFLMMRTAPDTVEVHTFSSETPQNLVKNYVGAAKLLKNQGIKRAITYADSPGYVEIAKKTGLPVKISQGQKVIGGTAKPVYTFELEL